MYYKQALLIKLAKTIPQVKDIVLSRPANPPEDDPVSIHNLSLLTVLYICYVEMCLRGEYYKLTNNPTDVQLVVLFQPEEKRIEMKVDLSRSSESVPRQVSVALSLSIQFLIICFRASALERTQ